MRYFFGFLRFLKHYVHTHRDNDELMNVALPTIGFVIFFYPFIWLITGLPIGKYYLPLIFLIIILISAIFNLRTLSKIPHDPHSSLTIKKFKTFYTISPDRFYLKDGEITYHVDDAKDAENTANLTRKLYFRTGLDYLRAEYFARQFEGDRELGIIAKYSREDIDKITAETTRKYKEATKAYEDSVVKATSSFADDFPTLANPTGEPKKSTPKTPEPPPETEKPTVSSSNGKVTHYNPYLGREFTDSYHFDTSQNP